MADRVEALVLQMSVDLRKLQKDMDKAKRTTSAGLSDVEGRFSKTSKKVKEEAGKMGSAFEDMARGIPVVGNAIADLGPAWTIAGAGAAALGLALKTVWDNAEQARKKIDDLGTSAENVSVSAESFQAFKALGIELDVTFETIEKGLNKLQVGAAEAQVETGALYNGLKKVDPALLAVIQSAETQEDRWDALSQAITGTDDQLKKVAIAKAAFGKEGAKFVRLLEGEDKTVAALTNRYRELGLILSEDLVRQVGAADQRLQLASARLDALKTRADAAWIPAVEAVTSAWLELNVALAQTFDRMNDLQGRQTDTLIADMKAQEVALNRAMKAWGEAEKNLSKYDQGPGATKEGIRKRAAMEVQQLRDDFYKEQARFFELRNLVNDRTQKINKGAGTNGELADQAAADAALEAEQRRVAEMAKLAAERDRQRQQAAQYLNELGDSTELLKIREEDLAKIVAAGFLTRQQADASLSAYAKSIDKVTDAEKEAAANAKIWASILEQAKTPVDRATEALGEFWDGIKYGQVPAADAAQILAILTKNLQDAEAAARGATPALQAVAAARAAIAEAENMSLSRAERLAKERKRLDDLVGQGGFTQKEADRSFKLFADQDAGQVAALAGKIQKGPLRTVDEPGAQEVLLAGGLATAPAFIAAALQVVALLELPAEAFEAAYEAGTLRDAVETDAKVLSQLPLADARARAARAMQNLAEGAGTSEGEAWSLLTSTVRQAFDNAVMAMADRMQTRPLDSLTDSQGTTDGLDGMSSTVPGTPTP